MKFRILTICCKASVLQSEIIKQWEEMKMKEIVKEQVQRINKEMEEKKNEILIYKHLISSKMQNEVLAMDTETFIVNIEFDLKQLKTLEEEWKKLKTQKLILDTTLVLAGDEETTKLYEKYLI